MIDEEPEELTAEMRDAELLLYDYFKHLTSLTLFSLGGVLALAERVRGTESFGMVISVVVLIGLAATCSFGGASEIVRSRMEGRRTSRQLKLYQIAAPTLLSIGIGGFVYLFGKTLVSG